MRPRDLRKKWLIEPVQMLVRKDLSRHKLQGQVAVGRWGETINMRSKKPE
jgi:hypothetical protein